MAHRSLLIAGDHVRARLLGFVNALRDAGLSCSVSEALDAMRAAAALGVEASVLRAALAATLVKDQNDRPTFDLVFDRYFGVSQQLKAKRKERREGGGDGSGGEAHGRGRTPTTEGARAGETPRLQHERGRKSTPHTVQNRAERSALETMPFEAMGPREVEELPELAAELGRRFRTRWSRRLRHANHGRVDMRRTIRRATTRGGVPLEIFLRRPRPGKTDLVALVDLSFSTATAANFLLALLAPARRFFRRVRLLGYVDAVSELSLEQGYVVPHDRLDLNARSDFGRVLGQLADRYQQQMQRNTVLLVLGDARNNRRPPRADLLAQLQRQVRAVVWLNPERRERWDTGDSVMSAYAKCTTSVVNASNPKTLVAALDNMARAQP